MATNAQMTPRMGRRDFIARLLGNSMLALGGSLVGVATAYEIYTRRAEAGLNSLRRGNYRFPGGPQPAAPATAGAAANARSTPASALATPAAAPVMEPGSVPADAPTAVPASSPPPGAEPAVFAATTPAEQAAGVTPDMLPVKLNIPSIGLNGARVIEVGTRIENGQLVWETANHAVGHHIGSAVPGLLGNVVLSGHISSPVRGEGSIFHNLPSLADKIGSRASVQTADGTWYHYEIAGTDVVTPADTWVLKPTPSRVLTLLTCVPDGVYTHRFVAFGKYLGRS